MVTEVYTDEICFGFSPLPQWIKPNIRISTEQLKGYETARFNSIPDFLREVAERELLNNKNIYNIHNPSPIEGILIIRKEGGPIFLGTQRLDELTAALDRILEGK